MPAQIAVVERLQIDVIEVDRARRSARSDPASNLIERGLAAAAAADDRHALSGRELEIDVLQDVRRFRSAVFETDIPQFDAAFEAWAPA